MKLVKTASGKQTVKISKAEWLSIGKTTGWMKTAKDRDSYVYKDHLIEMEVDKEPDNIKANYFVTKPNGEKIWAPISPYTWNTKVVEEWIDDGCPPDDYRRFTKEELAKRESIK